MGLQGVQPQRLPVETFLFLKKSAASRRGALRAAARSRLSLNPMETGMQKIFDGQVYKLARTEPYTRRDGSQTMLTVWRSHCADCGEVFELRTPTASSRFEPNRRCRNHKRPGVKVRLAAR